MCLSGLMGIRIKRKVGNYLGHHMVMKGRDRKRHKALLPRIQKRVAGWKTHCLSRAERLTLAQSVLGSMLVFQM